MWTSKLGNKYAMAWMQENDQTSQRELKRLRGLRGNGTCADCDRQDNSWASVSHGVFICVTCSDVHRSVGTHVSKVKGCTGTYLWGPDELEKMKSVGNQGANEIYGSKKVDPHASKEAKQRYVVEKYEKRSFACKPSSARLEAPSNIPKEEQRKPSAPRVNLQMTNARPQAPQQRANVKVENVSTATEVTDSLFDEIFNEAEDSYFGASSVALKSPGVGTQSSISPSCSPSDDGLDSFLNSTLSVSGPARHDTLGLNPIAKTQTAHPPTRGYPANLDPFADWPEF